MMNNDNEANRDMTPEDLLLMSTDTLLAMREAWKTQGRLLLDLSARAEAEVLRRLEADGASVYASEQWEAKVNPGAKSYTYNLEILAQLKPLLRQGEYKALVLERLVQEVDKRGLNVLERRGGEVARIIGEAVTAQEGPAKLTIKKLEAPDD